MGEESLGLRVGLDAGELLVGERGESRGLALNLAVRLCGVARASEALASQTVIHLAQKISGLSYHDRGVMTLRGFPDSMRIFQVLPVLPSWKLMQATPLASAASDQAQRETAACQRLDRSTYTGNGSASRLYPKAEPDSEVLTVPTLVPH